MAHRTGSFLQGQLSNEAPGGELDSVAPNENFGFPVGADDAERAVTGRTRLLFHGPLVGQGTLQPGKGAAVKILDLLPPGK